MSSFRDGDFTRRFESMGDEAEAVFEKVYPRGWTRYGLNRPAISLSKVPPYLRYTPDYMTSHGLVEVQGFGRDQTAKFKLPKLDALVEWDETFPVTFFLFDRYQDEYGYAPLATILSVIVEGGEHVERALFKEGTPYWAIKRDGLPVEEWKAVS